MDAERTSQWELGTNWHLPLAKRSTPMTPMDESVEGADRPADGKSLAGTERPFLPAIHHITELH